MATNDVRGFSDRGVNTISQALTRYKTSLLRVVEELDRTSFNCESAVKGTNAAVQVKGIARTASQAVKDYVNTLINEFTVTIQSVQQDYLKQDQSVDFSSIRFDTDSKS